MRPRPGIAAGQRREHHRRARSRADIRPDTRADTKLAAAKQSTQQRRPPRPLLAVGFSPSSSTTRRLIRILKRSQPALQIARAAALFREILLCDRPLRRPVYLRTSLACAIGSLRIRCHGLPTELSLCSRKPASTLSDSAQGQSPCTAECFARAAPKTPICKSAPDATLIAWVLLSSFAASSAHRSLPNFARSFASEGAVVDIPQVVAAFLAD